jgi:hypothetical protein
LPYVRADWFINEATRPGAEENPNEAGLYHKMLQLPTTAEALEKHLNVNVASNFQKDRLARGGFAQSGISGQNRLVERHSSSYGAYWKSYDFKRGQASGNLFKLPLGPKDIDREFESVAFKHDGGEVIFNLPNGLQGYMLLDGQGKRINAGPIDVVSDRLKSSGTAFIVNGLSCMVCHKNGMNPFTDTVRAGAGVFGPAQKKVERLYPPKEVMSKLVARDSEQFLRALQEATGPYLQVDADKEKPISSFEEPVGDVVARYLADLGLEEIAFELGIEDPAEVKTAIRTNTSLKELGLGPIANGDSIKRSDWESLNHEISLFQMLASELNEGIPYRQY